MYIHVYPFRESSLLEEIRANNVTGNRDEAFGKDLLQYA
jgi:hypothetical protein